MRKVGVEVVGLGALKLTGFLRELMQQNNMNFESLYTVRTLKEVLPFFFHSEMFSEISPIILLRQSVVLWCTWEDISISIIYHNLYLYILVLVERWFTGCCLCKTSVKGNYNDCVI